MKESKHVAVRADMSHRDQFFGRDLYCSARPDIMSTLVVPSLWLRVLSVPADRIVVPAHAAPD
jgi:hypothetical protein